MKKFILMVLVAGATAMFTPEKVNAQVSLNVNIGAQPRYVPVVYSNYYATPVYVQRSYYAPAPRYVYVKKNNWGHQKKAYRSVNPIYKSNFYAKPGKGNSYYKKSYRSAPKHVSYGKREHKGRH